MTNPDRWLQVVEYERSVKLRDELGNFVLIPKNELLELVCELLKIESKVEKGEDNVH